MPAPHVVVLTAPSGAGKTTIARRLLDVLPDLQFSVSATTRPPREQETHGQDYYFLSENDFRTRIESGDLLEYEEVYPGRFYGTLKSEVDEKGTNGGVLLDIDVKGAFNVKTIYGDDALVLFIAPPSMEELERRLSGRGTENDASMQSRLSRAEMEIEASHRADAVIVNDDLDRAVEETLQHVRQFLNS